MGRKSYLKDLESAQKEKSLSHYVLALESKEDGEFSFAFQDGAATANVTVSIPELADYPESHTCFLFASDDAPAHIARALEKVPDQSGKTVTKLVRDVSRHLAEKSQKPLDGVLELDSDGDTPMSFSQEAEREAFDAEDEDEYNPDDVEVEDWGFDDDETTSKGSPSLKTDKFVPTDRPAHLRFRMRTDLQAVKDAGFKFGHLGHPQQNSSGYLSISCRIAKLGISEEAMTAWSLEPSQYLILLMYFPSGYASLDMLTRMDPPVARQNVAMRIGVGNSYKPNSLEDARRAFKTNITTEQPQSEETERGSFKDTFISQALNDLLNERLICMLKYRLSAGFSWNRAEKFFQENMGKILLDLEVDNPNRYEAETTPMTLPDIVTADEVLTAKGEKELSFPLIAMQFVLRHFVRCTEFCLVCHCKIESDVEAIKPYVCDNPLCLYQYMNLGFGPSVEHEIMDQPLVVDLLVSFCYASASRHSLRTYPSGLHWIVPDVSAPIAGLMDSTSVYRRYGPAVHEPRPAEEHPEGISVQLDCSKLQFLFNRSGKCPVQPGDWIVFNIERDTDWSWHCRVASTNLFPTVQLQALQSTQSKLHDTASGEDSQMSEGQDAIDALSLRGKVDAVFWIYNVNFDNLPATKQSKTIQLLLDLMPSIQDMRQYLLKRPGLTLSNWKERMCPATAGLLRWIISSTRACIMQIDELPVATAEPPEPQKNAATTIPLGVRRSESRVQGMPGWLQFRFASGAPDKEQRFLNSISKKTSGSQYPTLFAWHGSPLQNWHSIIREGLNYKEVHNGRAFGDGCYHAKDFHTSGGYSGMDRGVTSWPHSCIRMTQAICLSEIVNAPQDFRCSKPHYVVQHCDWIQTRFLFVQSLKGIKVADDVRHGDDLPQDPSRKPTGIDSRPLELPITSLPKSRRPGKRPPTVESSRSQAVPAASPMQSLKKKFRLSKENVESLTDQTGGNMAQAIDLETISVATLEEDRALTRFERPPTPPPSRPSTKVTSFTPATTEGVPTLPPPFYATTMASMHLQRAFQQLSKTQQAHISAGTIADAGWYLDIEHLDRTDNLYQWIVSLHSFPLDLPLAKDMTDRDVTSIVFEIRFPPSFPHEPPFVRVIRPRFLPFQSGGGGHVTAGGSICMDLLTSSGWTAAYGIESVLVQIRSTLMSTEPRPARLEARHYGSSSKGGSGGGGGGEYGVGEAVDAYVRACNAHGWRVPPELIAVTGGSSGSRV